MTDRALPTGTITFLFSDIEGSTRLVQDLGPARFTEVLEQHNRILRSEFERHGGVERGTQGDSFLVMFPEAPQAVAAAAAIQRALHSAEWPRDGAVSVRMGLHSGVGTRGGDDYVGLDVNRAARIASAAHGGQILISDATRALTEGSLPEGAVIVPLGEHRLRDLDRPEVLHQVSIDGLPDSFPPPRAWGGAAAGNLPPRLTSFVGRDAELAELAGLLLTSRLVTLVGPGGTGKTSLAVELARREAARYRDGTWFVSLEAVADPALVPGVLAATFGLVAAGADSVASRLHAFLRDRTLLVVIDNFEHVVGAAALLPELLKAAPGLTIVATSRMSLRVGGEQEYPVAPLPVPGAGANPATSDALRLFEDRAAHVRPGYRLGAADLDAVADICRRLDGLPLGIELAASRMALLPARDIADRLGRRLDLPGGGSRDAPERQRTLEAAIAWSNDLLSAQERRLLERLSVFAGTFGLDEAESVCGPGDDEPVDVLEALSALVAHSLVQPVASQLGARFRLLATVRMFAADRLAQREDREVIRQRHARTYLALVEGVAPRLPGRGQGPLLDRLNEEHDNLRAAVDWAVEAANPDVALRLAAALWRFWEGRGHLDEGRAVIDRVLAVPGADAPTPARLAALDAAGGVAWWQGDLAAADSYYTEQVELARRIGDPHALAFALFNLSHTRDVRDDRSGSAALQDEAVRLFRETGDERGVARIGWIRANGLLRVDPAAARAELERLLARYSELDDYFYMGMGSGSLSWALLATGEYRGALEHGLESLRLALGMQDVGAATIAIHEVTILFHRLELNREAVILDGAYEAIRNRYGISTPAGFLAASREMWAGPDALRAAVGDVAFEQLHADGARMTIDDAAAFIEEIAKTQLQTHASAEASA